MPAPPHCNHRHPGRSGNLLVQTQKLLRKSFLTLDGTPPSMPGGKPLVHASESVRKRSRQANPEHSVARPARFLSFRAAQPNARDSFRGGTIRNFVQMQKTC